jgi:hypothetical protein
MDSALEDATAGHSTRGAANHAVLASHMSRASPLDLIGERGERETAASLNTFELPFERRIATARRRFSTNWVTPFLHDRLLVSCGGPAT